MRLVGPLVGACVATTVLAGCSGGGGGGGGGGSSSGGGELAEGGTFTYAVKSDPGNLDPHASASSELNQFSLFAYDRLVGITAEGTVVPSLAEDWEVDGETVTMTLAEDITCADGEPFTAQDAADNLSYIADPENQSFLLGVYVPPGVTAAAEGRTLTLTLAASAPFVMEGLSAVPMVCASGLADRSLLATETHGTGPFELTEAVPDDHYTFAKREGYTWGPDGASTDEEGTPDEVVLRVIANETTAANLLLSGEVNGAPILGRDAQRLEQSGLYRTEQTAVLGQMWFNQAEGRPAAEPEVRLALTQALDLAELASVLTSDTGGPGTSFAVVAPAACPGESVPDALPEMDLSAAQQALDEAGWTAGPDGTRSKDGTPLALTFLYATDLGSGGAAAAELAVAAWTELGADVTATPQDETASVETLFGTGDWDITWTALNVNSPDQLVPFLSGPAVPDGNNFAHIDNAEYVAGVEEAMMTVGSEGCDQWLEAEAALVRAADVVPFANQNLPFFGSNARFDVVGGVVPTSIRMLAD